jgi:type II secretory pathway component PulF
MECPSCEFDQPDSGYCMACGIDIQEYLSPAAVAKKKKEEAAVRATLAAAAADGVGRKKLRLKHSEKLDMYAGLARVAKSRRVKTTLVEAMIKLAVDAAPRIRRVLAGLAQRVEDGGTLSAAMVTYPSVFDSTEINIVKSYERSECTLRAFPTLADRTWRQSRFQEWIKRAAFYPVMILFLAAILLPIRQVRVGGIHGYLAGAGIYLMILVFGGFLVFRVFPAIFNLPKVRGGLKRMAWYLPYPANIYRMWVRSVFCKVLADHLSHDMPTPRALHSAATVTQDGHIIRAANNVINDEGAKREMASKLWSEGLIESGDAMFIISGEYSNELVGSLNDLSKEYEEKSIKQVQQLLFFSSTGLAMFLFVFFGLSAIEGLKEMGGDAKDLLNDLNQGN